MQVLIHGILRAEPGRGCHLKITSAFSYPPPRRFALILRMFIGAAPTVIASFFTVPEGAVGWKIALLLGLLVLAIVLFALEKTSVDIITFCLLLPLIFLGVLSPDQAFRGFSSEAVMSLAAIYVISGALTATGVLDLVGSRIMRIGGGSEARVIFMLMLIACSVSAFMNNTTVTAMFAPAAVVLARRTGINPSKILMPLAFASILGGTTTLIGTSTNIAVNNYLREHGVAAMTMFEITPVGLIICVVGIAYMMFVGRKQLAARADTDAAAGYSMREYLSEIIIMPGSPLIGQRSFESDLSILDFRILKIIRGKDSFMPDSRIVLEQGDVLLVEGKVENLMKVRRIEGIEIKAQADLDEKALKGANFRTAEMLVTLQSEVSGRTLIEADFRSKYGITVLALYRHGETVVESIGDLVIRTGDVLLVQGSTESMDHAREKYGLSLLDEVKPTLYHPRRGIRTVVLFLLAVIASAAPVFPLGRVLTDESVAVVSGLSAFFFQHGSLREVMLGGVSAAGGLSTAISWQPLPVSVAFLLAAVGAVAIRAISVEKAYEFVDWKLIVLIGGMTAFGAAMSSTKTDVFLANAVVHFTGGMGPFWVMAGFFVLTIILTQPMSNAAAALVVLPVALTAAKQLGVSQHSFAMAVMLAASISFITPFEPSCLLVYGPGKYRFRDFVKVGFGLTAVLGIVMLILIPILWPLTK
jgi:di/tricarboxylate transporter